jgi:DNA-binding phage protein
MALTKNFKQTTATRIQKSSEFRTTLFEEAIRNILEGEHSIAKSQLRDLINAGPGFDAIAEATNILKPSLMRMLSRKGNPRITNLSIILDALIKSYNLSVTIIVETEDGS